MAVIRMTSLRRKKNGDYFARKGVPEEVRVAYEAAHGKRQEERFVRPASLAQPAAAQEFRDWDAEIVSRIERLRARARGEGEAMLTQRQAHALAGEWYSWFVVQHEADPGSPEQWEAIADEHESLCLRHERRDEHSDPLLEAELRSPHAQRVVREFLAARAAVAAFLYARGRTLGEGAMQIFLDALEADFLAALDLLRRRAEGDYRPDSRPASFPPAKVLAGGHNPSGLTVWTAFELWIETRRPAVSSVNRWRAVFIGLRDKFGDREIEAITAEEAQGWIDGLPSEDRSPHTVQEVWLRAARTVFAWAVKKKRLGSSPFAAATFPVPKRPGMLRRKHFRDAEWCAILRATLEPPPPGMAAHNAAARRWVPC